jgi:hypothetical protein
MLRVDLADGGHLRALDGTVTHVPVEDYVMEIDDLAGRIA